MTFTIEHVCAECGLKKKIQYWEVCGICYHRACPTKTKSVMLCNDCYIKPDLYDGPNEPLIDEGESLFM